MKLSWLFGLVAAVAAVVIMADTNNEVDDDPPSFYMSKEMTKYLVKELHHGLTMLKRLHRDVYEGTLPANIGYYFEKGITDAEIEFDYRDDGIDALIKRAKDEPSNDTLRSILIQIKKLNRVYLLPNGLEVFSYENNDANIVELTQYISDLSSSLSENGPTTISRSGDTSPSCTRVSERNA